MSHLLKAALKMLTPMLDCTIPDGLLPTTPESRALVAIKAKLLPVLSGDKDLAAFIETFSKTVIHDIDHKPELRAQLHDALLDIADLIYAEVDKYENTTQTATTG